MSESHRYDEGELHAYFSRINFQGTREPSLGNLHEITRAHTSSIPFENLDVLLGRGIQLAPEALFGKLVTQRRGGYCFEQNGLLLGVLSSLGFSVTPISARVRLDRPRDYTPARTHVFLRVELEGVSWLTDVGVGGMSLTQALRLHTDEPQTTPHETRRIVRESGRYFHQVLLGEAWNDVCEFTLEEMPPIDRELGNWYTSAHPGSHFKNRLLIARAGEDGTRITLLNSELKLRARDGTATVTKLETPQELLTALSDQFHLHFPPETRFSAPGALWPA